MCVEHLYLQDFFFMDFLFVVCRQTFEVKHSRGFYSCLMHEVTKGLRDV